MPKSRNSSIANRDDTATYDETEMSDRVEDRLAETEAVIVSVESRSRGTMENLAVRFTGGVGGRGRANVSSGSGRIYHVDLEAETCDCPDHIHRQNRCRHIEAVDQAREQITSGAEGGSAADNGIDANQVTREIIGNESDGELRNNSASYQDDGFFYTDHPEQFREDMDRALREPIPYQYENTLNGANVTFGVELEFVGGNSDAIAAELYQLGLCGHDRMQRYHADNNPGLWRVEQDGSVTDIHGRGGEIISPVLTDTPETWRQIKTVCDVAKRHGARVDYHTGGHVHIGAEEPLDGKRQRWKRLFKSIAGFEETMLRLSGGEQGRFRGGEYAPSSIEQSRAGISAIMPKEGTLQQFKQIIQRISHGKYQSVNVGAFVDKGTVEFRAFNGTLTPEIIQANVKFAAGVVKSSERSRTQAAEGFTITEQDQRRGSIINDYLNNNQRTEYSMMRALDAIFPRREDKRHIMAVLARNDWAL